VADEESGGSKILRGLLIALVTVAAIVLIIVFWRNVVDAAKSLGTYVSDHVPATTGGKASVVVYILVAILLSVLFSKAGHFTAYGIAMGLVPLLWFLFWEGFPLLGLHPTWTDGMGLDHLRPGLVVLWAVIADVIITVVFVPLELREKWMVRRHRLGESASD
jgi:hypothetical protein